MNMEFLQKYRVLAGPLMTRPGDLFGLFYVPLSAGPVSVKAFVISAPFDGSQEWEHVSVSIRHRCPTWEEMCFIKDLFWDKNQCVIQFHPPESEYVNNHPFCLHLWRHRDGHKTPPAELVGIK